MSAFSPPAASATYAMRIPSLDLELDWRFAVEGNELVFDLTKVSEGGSFHLQTLDFPDQYLFGFLPQTARVKPIAANTTDKSGVIHIQIFSGNRPPTS